ncbi:GTPase activating protein [Lobosporangium transversale]|uniref:GTPase-activating protein GYP7 n=1 Tax=Lobosporangium transversale TaxID=64571 RepID=A0A1Y2H0B8_9FUNG|nr:rab-GTPase-TBC domain-containing protein [Lobosporangium transversale]KAF9907153.1 GTPase activating protein [Lobosporangium transversale]ORZ26512.1 rab-GTPase-TBC domain-containing protein [Lobosporangium transversale]|eukprot:XP_021884277.1 rab-GTPase-TBC domain-containing protein [Lobosporangium transversale]
MDNDSLVAQMEDFEIGNSAMFAQPKLLFTRPKVFVKTTAKDDLPGFLTIIETANHDHIMSWTPEASIPGLDDDSYVDISSQGDHEEMTFVAPPRSPNPNRRSFHPSDYAVSIPLQTIYSLIVYPPRVKDRHGSVIVNLIGGESLPAFYFHEDGAGKASTAGPSLWDGQELLDRMGEVVDIVGSAIEPGVYLVNASQADKINHGAASPPHPLSPKIQDRPLEDTHHQPKVDEKSDKTNPAHPTEQETTTQDSATLRPEGTSITSPITVEGMRRRRSFSGHHRDKSVGDVHQQLVSANGSLANGSSSGSSGPTSGRSRTPLPFEGHIDPLVNSVKELRWNILERFSQVARFSRDTATNILDHPITKQILPPHVQQKLQDSEAAKRMMDEYDSARVYLARWAAAVADQGDRERREMQEMERLQNGTSHTGKHRAHGREGRRINDHEDEEGPLGTFNVLDLETECSLIHHTRTEPLSPMDWFAFFDDVGRLTVSEEHVREAVFRGGIDHDIRIEVWKFFLGIYPWESTEAERVAIRSIKAEEYYALKREWFDDATVQDTEAFQEQKLRIEKDVHRTDRTISFFASETLPNPAGDFTGVGSNENLELLKDILLTYNIWAAKDPSVRPPPLSTDKPSLSTSSSTSTEPNLLEGYVQGMSDLLAPVFAVMGDEVMGFWAFVGLMEKTKKNFYRDQIGMQSQLETLGELIQALDPKLYKHLEKCEALNFFFCFRWLLIWFKREFEWVDIMRLWEVLFSDHLSTQFHLFVAMAIIDKHRDVIMDHLQGFDEILKYINDLSMTIDLEETLQNAEILYRRLEHLIETVNAKRQAEEAAEVPATTPEIPATLRNLLKAHKDH